MEHEHPFPGNKVANTKFKSEGEYVGVTETKDTDLESANILTSKVDLGDLFPKDHGLHRPVLDIDLPIKLVPSSTPGHFHLYIDKLLTWDQYQNLLWGLQQAGILEPGYVSASTARGFTAVRLPWVEKELF